MAFPDPAMGQPWPPVMLPAMAPSDAASHGIPAPAMGQPWLLNSFLSRTQTLLQRGKEGLANIVLPFNHGLAVAMDSAKS